MQICGNLNKERKRNPLYKISDKYEDTKNRRKNIEVVGTSYEAGSF